MRPADNGCQKNGWDEDKNGQIVGESLRFDVFGCGGIRLQQD